MLSRNNTVCMHSFFLYLSHRLHPLLFLFQPFHPASHHPLPKLGRMVPQLPNSIPQRR